MLTVQRDEFVTGVAFGNAVLCFFGEILRGLWRTRIFYVLMALSF